jgi:predicted outer membrane repeat protein
MNLQGDRKFGLVVLALAVVPLMVALMAPPATAAQPCQTKNVRTGVEYKGASALATAITAAASGDTITVWGTCFGNFALGKDLTLQGKGKATLDGNQHGRVLNITAGKATIRNLVITNGHTDADDAGGGILIDAGASAALVDTTVRDNTAGSGSFGGGIEANGNLLLIRSAVTRNSAGSSGGIDMNLASVSLVSSSVTHNTATHVPGSLPNDGCGFAPDPLRYACGGGIWNFNGTLSLTDSTVNANTAAYRGGGLRTSSTINDGLVVSGITLLAGSTTIDGNTAGDRGGGIFARLAGTPEPPPVIQEPASLTFRVADGSPSYTDPLTGNTLPAWTGSVSGNTPDQCFPVLTLGTHNCGLTFN